MASWTKLNDSLCVIEFAALLRALVNFCCAAELLLGTWIFSLDG
jgi:hypothetical protein